MVGSDGIEFVFLIDDIGVVVVVQDVHQASPIPVICHSSSVIYMSGSVCQDFERSLRILKQKHMQLRDANLQVPIGKLVGDIKPQRSELPSFQQNRVKQAKGEQHPLESVDLFMFRMEKVGHVRDLVGVGSKHVGLDPSGWFYGHLGAILQDRDGKVGGGGRSQPHAEVPVGSVGSNGFSDAFQARHPAGS